jgi:hypothetical protein
MVTVTPAVVVQVVGLVGQIVSDLSVAKYDAAIVDLEAIVKALGLETNSKVELGLAFVKKNEPLVKFAVESFHGFLDKN